MSNLTIKGMDIPEGCAKCAMRYMSISCEFKCVFTNDYVGNFIKRRLSNCPLVEIPTPHGRLIDADELLEVIEANDYTLSSRLKNTIGRGMFTIDIKQAIDESSTIIEAEQGDG